MTNPKFLELANRLGNESLSREKAVKQEKILQRDLSVQADINKADYVKIPNTNILIARIEQDEYKGLTWQNTHYKLNENGLFMPTPKLFMPYFMNVIDAHKRKIQLYDGLGNQISEQEVEDIYKHLTIDHINGGAWSWLDAEFKVINDRLHINYNHKIINNDLQPCNIEPLEKCIMEDCYVSLRFNKQGLPIEESGDEYKQGENIYYWKPEEDNNSIARFFADSGGAGLVCDGLPLGSDSVLGVFSCAEGTSKN